MRAVLPPTGKFPYRPRSLCSSPSNRAPAGGHTRQCQNQHRSPTARRCRSSSASSDIATSARQAGAAEAQLQDSSALSLVEWDVVMYEAGDGMAIGRISQLRSEAAVIDRLEEEGESLWAVSDRVDEVPLQQVQCVLEADYMQLCDPDRISNPHGEHAYEVFRILQVVPPEVWGSLQEAG